ncbi:MAG: serine/threonine protein kinase [Planctomycetes bacterium]|nr:serine/threonine protein kinase [Planctomycetota bacterium]
MDWETFYARFREPGFVPGFEIGNRLGGGAFGEVYKARKASIGKSYAIKFLKVDGDAARDAAMRELEQVRHFASLDHPNLVSIEDLGVAGGVPYLVMGYAGEETLAKKLKQGALDEPTALLYFVQVARGVLALHDRRLVHFDLKPGNVFLKGDVARVGDYGLSKMLADGRSTLSFGRGTPQYMAPEMLKNRADHRADIYSLGVILYECLSGRLPYEPAVPGAFHVREDDLPPPFPPEFPARWQPVVARCLRLAPEDRFANVAELLAALGHSARVGDSARWPAAGAPQPTGTAAGGPPTPPRSEARQTAAELTRGAVEVARGVWDGLRPGAGEPQERGARPGSTDRAVPVAGPGPQESGGAAGAQAADTPFVQRALAVVRSGGPASAAALDVLEVHTLSDAAVVRLPPTELVPTIPVPPPAPGGWFGTLRATARLALEVFLALTGWLVGGARRLLARGGGAARGAFAGFVVGAVRLTLFALFLALLGAVTTLAAFLLLRGRAGGS